MIVWRFTIWRMQGRNRRYYKLTDRGAAQLEFYKAEWKIYASKISGMFEGGIG